MTIADVRQSITLPPKETIAHFRSLGIQTQAHWDETWQEEHARAFTVTKIMDLQLLGQVRASLDKVLSQGGTFEQWKKELVPQLKAAGWYGRVENKELTGVDHAVFVGDKRLRTIYDTNLRMARAAGKWQRIQALKAGAPYLMYSAVKDSHTRPLHRLWGGLDTGRPIILQVDHPAWSVFFPPCGWGCRCGVVQLSERDLQRRGLRVTTDADLIALGWLGSDGSVGGNRKPYQRTNGDIVLVPDGVDPGFAYNPGTASLSGLARQAADVLAETAKTNLRGARAVLNDLIDSPAFDHFLNEPEASFPVMLLDPEMTATIGAKTPVVVLSAVDAGKQAARHPDVPIDAYRLLPGIGEAPTIVARDRASDTHFYFLQARGGYWLVAVIKRTVSGGAVFLNSYRIQGEASLARLLRDADVIIDARH